MRCSHLVVIIDNDPISQQELRHTVRNHGFDTQAYGSCEAFLFSGIEPGCAVLDSRLRGMQWHHLKARLREVGRSVPLVVIASPHEDLIEFQENVQIIRRPVDRSLLIRAIESSLRDGMVEGGSRFAGALSGLRAAAV